VTTAKPDSGRRSVLVVGGGIAGLTAAVEAAEIGAEVHLVEKGPYFGGRVAALAEYFPKLCPPSCGLEINLRRVRQNPRIHCHLLTEVVKVEGGPGDFKATLRQAPRFVNERCTGCGDCIAKCPVDRPSDFDYGMTTTRAVYLPAAFLYPMLATIDPSVCPGETCAKCVPACTAKAIDLAMKPTETTLNVGGVVMATGWHPYDAAKLDGLGFGVHKDVITNTMMERLASPDGPTKGKIVRPSDGAAPQHVTFVQCAGSRDDNHLSYCSAVCCLASFKQIAYVRERLPETAIHLFYIDVRTPGRNELFQVKVGDDPKVSLVRGKVAKVDLATDKKNLIVEAEDTISGARVRLETQLVVLATGMVPNTAVALPAGLERDAIGFVTPAGARLGVDAAGCARRPADVASSVKDATGAVLKATRPADGVSANG
jgi:quinone-modifying oxidoreductase, subunit QmoA